MAIKKISEFVSALPADDDYILFEKNGAGKSAKFSDFSLSWEEILASTDLSGKVASADGAKSLGSRKVDYVGTFESVDEIKSWVVSKKPQRAWIADTIQSCSVALGGIFNPYGGGYVAFIFFGYFSDSIDIYKLNDGSWNK